MYSSTFFMLTRATLYMYMRLIDWFSNEPCKIYQTKHVILQSVIVLVMKWLMYTLYITNNSLIYKLYIKRLTWACSPIAASTLITTLESWSLNFGISACWWKLDHFNLNVLHWKCTTLIIFTVKYRQALKTGRKKVFRTLDGKGLVSMHG